MYSDSLEKIKPDQVKNLTLRPHQINFMDDGFSAEKNGANEQILLLFFSNFFFDFRQKWSERRSDNFLILKN